MQPAQSSLPQLCLAAFLLIVSRPGALLGADSLTLRLNDTAAAAGERVAVVLRTYAPRSISQGQICFRSVHRTDGAAAANSPFTALEEVRVFSEMGDVEVIETFDSGSQTALIAFESLSATINWADGPMAVFFFRLDGALAPGQEFALELDFDETFVLDETGQSIAVEPRGGELTIRQPGAPYALAVDGDEVAAGEVAELGIETSELFAIGSGQVALRFDPDFAAGVPTVTMDERYGMASFSVDASVPGRVVITFASPDGSLNEVPGQLIRIALPTSPDMPSGSQADLSLDPLLTGLQDPSGGSIALQLEGDLLTLGTTSLVFADDFEAGDLSRWQ